ERAAASAAVPCASSRLTGASFAAASFSACTAALTTAARASALNRPVPASWATSRRSYPPNDECVWVATTQTSPSPLAARPSAAPGRQELGRAQGGREGARPGGAGRRGAGESGTGRAAAFSGGGGMAGRVGGGRLTGPPGTRSLADVIGEGKPSRHPRRG